VACFERDIAGALGLHRAGVVQYLRPEIIGFVLGAFFISIFTKEYRPRAGSSTLVRFFLGVFAMIGALVFLGCPWGEKPMEILQLVRNYLTTSNIKSNKNYKKTKEENYHQAHNKIINYLKDKQPSLIPFFEKVLSLLRTFIIIDNEQHFYASRLFMPTRQLLHLIGEILVSKNIIQNPKDIYFLTEPEIDELIYRDASFPRNYLIEKRKASFYRSKKKSPPDEFIDNFPIFKKNEFCQQEITIKKKDAQNSSWKGIGASPGITTGKIKKIETINQIHDFKGDEILVTTSPNPIWASVFPIVSGLISETGDILSHGLVLAREYNLPAVINIPNITKNLKDGQKVKIDGTQGLITLI
jgi:pyruvate,water dikinase